MPRGVRREPLGLNVSSSRGGALLSTLIDDLVLLHLAVERRAIQPEDLRGFLLVPVRPLEGLQNGHLFDFSKRSMRRDGEILSRSPLFTDGLGQIVGKNL